MCHDSEFSKKTKIHPTRREPKLKFRANHTLEGAKSGEPPIEAPTLCAHDKALEAVSAPMWSTRCVLNSSNGFARRARKDTGRKSIEYKFRIAR